MRDDIPVTLVDEVEVAFWSCSHFCKQCELWIECLETMRTLNMALVSSTNFDEMSMVFTIGEE